MHIKYMIKRFFKIGWRKIKQIPSILKRWKPFKKKVKLNTFELVLGEFATIANNKPDNILIEFLFDIISLMDNINKIDISKRIFDGDIELDLFVRKSLKKLFEEVSLEKRDKITLRLLYCLKILSRKISKK